MFPLRPVRAVPAGICSKHCHCPTESGDRDSGPSISRRSSRCALQESWSANRNEGSESTFPRRTGQSSAPCCSATHGCTRPSGASHARGQPQDRRAPPRPRRRLHRPDRRQTVRAAQQRDGPADAKHEQTISQRTNGDGSRKRRSDDRAGCSVVAARAQRALRAPSRTPSLALCRILIRTVTGLVVATLALLMLVLLAQTPRDREPCRSAGALADVVPSPTRVNISSVAQTKVRRAVVTIAGVSAGPNSRKSGSEMQVTVTDRSGSASGRHGVGDGVRLDILYRRDNERHTRRCDLPASQ